MSIDAFYKSLDTGDVDVIVRQAKNMVDKPRLHSYNVESLKMQRDKLMEIRDSLAAEKSNVAERKVITRCNEMISRLNTSIAVRSARLDAGLTSMGLSAAMGKHSAFVSQVETCTKYATPENRDAILRAIRNLKMVRMPRAEREAPSQVQQDTSGPKAMDTTSAIELLRMIEAVNKSGAADVKGDLTMNFAVTVKV
jgi:hypothetical protein